MSINQISQKTLEPRSFRTLVPSPYVDVWVRNPSWPALTTVTAAEQKIVALHAVFEAANFVSFTCRGAYTVDWGDGVSENVADNTQCYHEYDFADADLANTNAPVTFTDAGDLVTRNSHGYKDGMRISFYSITTTTGITAGQIYYVVNSTTNTFQVSATEGGAALPLTTNGTGIILPYKIAVITITPQAGSNLTSADFQKKHNQAGLQTGYGSGFLDINISMPNGATLVFGGATTIKHGYVERCQLVAINTVSTFANFFYNCYSLQEVIISCATGGVTTTQTMFQNCYMLKKAPFFDTSGVGTITSMFDECYSLIEVPLYNFASVTTGSSVFQNCRSLKKVPSLDLHGVTSPTYFFEYCYALEEVGDLNLSAATSLLNFFTNCSSLKRVGKITTTVALLTVRAMFSGCSSLKEIPLFTTSAVTTFYQFIYACSSLKRFPLFDTSSCTDMYQMCYNCQNLEEFPLLDTADVTDVTGLFQNCYKLVAIPALNLTSVASGKFSNMVNACISLAQCDATGINHDVSFLNCKLSAAELDNIYTNLPAVVGKTITVTGNYGTAADTPTIATDKGWTVTS